LISSQPGPKDREGKMRIKEYLLELKSDTILDKICENDKAREEIP